MRALLEQAARDVAAALGLDRWSSRSHHARALPITTGQGQAAG